MLKKIVLFSILLMISSLSYADVRVYVEPASIASGATGKVYVKVDGFVDLELLLKYVSVVCDVE